MGFVGARDLVGRKLSVLVPRLLLRVEVDRDGALAKEGCRELPNEAGEVRKPERRGGDGDDVDLPLRLLREPRNLRRFGLAGASERVEEHDRGRLALELGEVGRAVHEPGPLRGSGQKGGPKGGERGEASNVHGQEGSAKGRRQLVMS
jgi:hypothetical protein